MGECDPKWLGGAIPIAGDAGDQQAATFGQACFDPGSAKNTYGTGCFLLMNTGERPSASKHGLLTTVGWRINGRTTYCLEGSVFVAGAAVQWLRDGLGLIQHANQTAALATSVSDNGGVYFVPAFVGLGAPHWDANARGIITGLTRGTTKAHLARAALEAMAYQTADVLDAMRQDSGVALQSLRVDGGATSNDWLMQFQSDILGVAVRRPVVQETTALGAAYLAGLATGVWPELSDVSKNWQLDRQFGPVMPDSQRNTLMTNWHQAVSRASH